MASTPNDLSYALEHLDAATQTALRTYHFDRASFVELAGRLAAKKFTPAHNQIEGEIAPLEAGDVTSLREADAARLVKWRAVGERAIANKEVAVAILNGGMATRFGGRVKGIVDVLPGHSFLSLKLQDAYRHHGNVPVFLMNSFATDKATREHLLTAPLKAVGGERAHCVLQTISMRLTPEGELYMGKDRAPSLFAPGHGDLMSALADSPAYQAFCAQGGKYILVSNVDNLGATCAPEIIGAHIALNKKVTVEVAPKNPEDAGGAPVRRNGRVEVLEGFRFPPDFDHSQLRVFNTNTFVFSISAIHKRYPWTWFRADKKVDGQPVVQFERLVGEVTSFEDATFLEVSRSGATCRFLPAKAPDDLAKIMPFVEKYLLKS